MSEAFNSTIVIPRTKPIVTMCEDIRDYLMENGMQTWQKLLVMRMMCFPTSRIWFLENLPTLVTEWLGMW